MDYAAYGKLRGHVAIFETGDQALAADVAARLTSGLAESDGERVPSSFFVDNLDSPAGSTARPGMGDFGVSLGVQARQTTPEGPPVFTVTGATYGIRDTDPERGVAQLQTAFTRAVEEAVAYTVERPGVA